VHGAKTAEYLTWERMKRRCLNPNSADFAEYGARGIGVCERWRNSFSAFFDDMGPKPTPTHSIDRIDGRKGYEPGNCRWATKREQSANTSRTIRVRVNGEGMCLVEAAKKLRLAVGRIHGRYKALGIWALYGGRGRPADA
jgi:hypothetical protein